MEVPRNRYLETCAADIAGGRSGENVSQSDVLQVIADRLIGVIVSVNWSCEQSVRRTPEDGSSTDGRV
jgi:hypothetical protein